MSKIRICTCEHAYQDQVYGKGKRVWTESKGDKITCTVCGTVAIERKENI